MSLEREELARYLHATRTVERAKSIEALSLVFTAGVIAGTLVPAMSFPAIPAIILPTLGAAVLLKRKIALAQDSAAILSVLGIFLLLGAFCALSCKLPYVPGSSAGLKGLAQAAGESLRMRIDAIPFRADNTSALLKAFLTGDRSDLPAGTVSIFRQSGASHLLALSGLHIGIIYTILDRLTLPLGKTRPVLIIRYLFFVAGGGFFTLMTGASPSIVRAFLFILIRETLIIIGRPVKASRVLCLALLVQLVADPSVIGSVGFQLSYLAMAGIFLINPLISGLYPAGGRLNPMKKIWDSVSLTISCQAFTAPLSWHYFHSFPRHFILTNLMAIPLATGVVASGAACAVLSAIGPCPGILIKATDFLCNMLLWVLEVISGM